MPKSLGLTKEEMKARLRAYRAAYNPAYNAKNKEKRKAHDAEKYLKERDRYLEYSRRYKAGHKDEAKISRAKYVAANKAKIAAKARAYQIANPEKFRNITSKRRALKRNAPIGDTRLIVKWEKTWRTKRAVICYWCGVKGRGAAMHVDHIIALKNGGSHSIGNLCISCQSCNTRKHAKTLAAWNSKIAQPVLF